MNSLTIPPNHIIFQMCHFQCVTLEKMFRILFESTQSVSLHDSGVYNGSRIRYHQPTSREHTLPSFTETQTPVQSQAPLDCVVGTCLLCLHGSFLLCGILITF